MGPLIMTLNSNGTGILPDMRTESLTFLTISNYCRAVPYFIKSFTGFYEAPPECLREA